MRVLSLIGSVLLSFLLAYAMLWGSLALWFRMPVADPVKYLMIAAFLLPGAFAIVHLFTWRTLRSLTVFVALLAMILGWWQTLDPPAEGDWEPAVARQVTGTIDGDTLSLENVRAFRWHAHDNVDEVWVNRTYDLSELETVDLFLSYWGDPKMAHFMLSFGFGKDVYLAWSVEVRREKGDVYSPVGDFFKEHALVIVAAEEYDVVGMRSNLWDNDVHIFRLRGSDDVMRGLLEGYVRDANSLAAEPRWYNSIFTNCTTVVFKTMMALGIKIPFDWRIVVNGYLPELMHDRGAVNTSYSADELRELGRIAERAKAIGLVPGYSAAIREGVPAPY